MQDTQAIAGGGGRLFAGAGERRSHHQQGLKCPRCDSLNTKFCYYNNYNLSQPRYFCKGCRRYWTKGGVLRNVPVGGGCRKTKRSSKAKNTTPPSNSNSSSDSSSLTAAATTTTTEVKNSTTTGEVGSDSAPNPSSDSRYILDQPQPLIDPIGAREGQIFTEMGSFTSLMTSSNDPAGMLSFSTDISGFQVDQLKLQGGGELKMEEQISYLDDQTTHIGGLSGLDWQINDGGGGGGGGGEEQGLFDFTGAVDQTYWGQNQWSDHDHDRSLNFPPLV